MTSIDEATPAYEQHKTPCHDCPWRREAIRGWLGGSSVDDWLRDAHGDASIPCHVYAGAQCAGAAIYRRNVCKKLHDPDVLVLGIDKITVFANPMEFREHHEGSGPSVSAQTSETVNITVPESVGVSIMAKTNNEAIEALKAKHATVVAKVQAKSASAVEKLTAKHDKKLANIMQTVAKLTVIVQEILALAGTFTSLKPKSKRLSTQKLQKPPSCAISSASKQ